MSQVEIVRRVYEAGAAQDLDELLDLPTPPASSPRIRRCPGGGRHVGHQGLTAFLSALFATIDSEASTEARFEADGHVIPCGRTRGAGAGERGDLRAARGTHLDVRNSKVVAAHFAIDTPAMLQALEGV